MKLFSLLSRTSDLRCAELISLPPCYTAQFAGVWQCIHPVQFVPRRCDNLFPESGSAACRFSLRCFRAAMI